MRIARPPAAVRSLPGQIDALARVGVVWLTIDCASRSFLSAAERLTSLNAAWRSEAGPTTIR